jgi:hypothetical protein
VVVDISPIGVTHAYLVDRIARRLARQEPLLPLGGNLYVRVQQPIQATEVDQLVPDVSVVLGPPDRYRARLPGRGDVSVVVEVSDTTFRRDAEKLAAYQAAGVRRILIIDVGRRRVFRWARTDRDPSGWLATCWYDGQYWLAGMTVDWLFEEGAE